MHIWISWHKWRAISNYPTLHTIAEPSSLKPFLWWLYSWCKIAFHNGAHVKQTWRTHTMPMHSKNSNTTSIIVASYSWTACPTHMLTHKSRRIWHTFQNGPRPIRTANYNFRHTSTTMRDQNSFTTQCPSPYKNDFPCKSCTSSIIQCTTYSTHSNWNHPCSTIATLPTMQLTFFCRCITCWIH